MLGKQWSSILFLIQEISAVVSITINIILIWLVLTKSPKNLGAYRWLMVYISVFEIIYSILDVILAPQHFSDGPTFLVIVGTKNKLFGPETLTLLNAFYWGFFGASMAVFAVHFVYRWLVVTNNRLLRSFQDWRICLWFSIPLWYGMTWICTGYFLSAPNESTTDSIRDSVKAMFELEFNEYIYLGPHLFDRKGDGKVDFHLNAFATILVITITIITSLTIVLIFGYLCYARINRLVATTSDSLKFKKLQKQLFYSLVIQTLIPFVLMHIPGGIMTAFVIFDIDLSVYSAVLSMTIAIYPAVDPIPTLVIVESYRNTLLRLLGIYSKTNPMGSSLADSSKF
uniref:Serpentine receptor class r-10 n=1 Tax=Caenorhabditis tropicalis TaxID=1561998 RepID=A0A1I7U9I8_9PELO